MSEAGAAIASSADFEGHPAVRAWRAFGSEAAPPDRVEKLRQNDRSAVYRLEGARPDGRAVIAKRCRKQNGRFERAIYQRILSGIPDCHLEYYGLISESDSDYCWQFMEDAGDIIYREEDPRHRQALSGRLGLLHAQASHLALIRDLPDRGPKLHLDYLCSGRQKIRQWFDGYPMNADIARILGRLLASYEILEPRWPYIASVCESSPRAFVHGDVSSRNIRLRITEGMPVPLLFDWEWAGRGSPASDLWLMEPEDAAIYQAAVKDVWPDLGVDDIKVLIRIAVILRSILVLQWKSQELGRHPIDRPLRVMRSFNDRLTRTMSSFGWT